MTDHTGFMVAFLTSAVRSAAVYALSCLAVGIGRRQLNRCDPSSFSNDKLIRELTASQAPHR